MALLSGIHPIAEALRAGNPIERIVIAQGAGGPRLQEIIDLARRASVPVRFEPRSSLDRLATSAARRPTTRWITRQRASSYWAAKAAGSTSRCARTATFWCASPWRAKSLR